MAKNSKYVINQIKYVDDLLKIYGIQCLSDYQSQLGQNQISQNMISQINHTMEEFKTYFPTKGFNLGRKNYQIDSPTLALSFLKNCLNHIGMPFETLRTSKTTSMRLKPINKMLVTYIETIKMTDITHHNQIHLEEPIHHESYQLVCLEEEKKISIKATKLGLNMIQSLIGKIQLLNLPTQYTYIFYINGTKVLESEIEDGMPTFNFSRKDSEQLNIFRDIINCPTKDQVNFKSNDIKNKKINLSEVLNFARIDSPEIDVRVLDPNDTFHIYNPITHKFKEDLYEIKIQGYNVNPAFNQNNPFTETLKLYPNQTFSLPLNLLVEEFEIQSNSLNSIESCLLTEYGYLYPDPNVPNKYTFGENQQFDNSYPYLNQIEYQKLQQELSESLINKKISTHFLDKRLNHTTLNFSRLERPQLIIKDLSKNDILKVKVKSYNLQVTKHFDNGKTESYLAFA